MLVTPVLIYLIAINQRKTIWRGKLTAGQEASVGENITSDTAHSFCPGCHNRWHVMQSNGQRRGGTDSDTQILPGWLWAAQCNAFDGRRCTVLRLRSIQAAGPLENRCLDSETEAGWYWLSRAGALNQTHFFLELSPFSVAEEHARGSISANFFLLWNKNSVAFTIKHVGFGTTMLLKQNGSGAAWPSDTTFGQVLYASSKPQAHMWLIKPLKAGTLFLYYLISEKENCSRRTFILSNGNRLSVLFSYTGFKIVGKIVSLSCFLKFRKEADVPVEMKVKHSSMSSATQAKGFPSNG